MNYVTINKNEYAVKFGLASLKEAMAKYGLSKLLDTEKLMSEIEISYIPKLLSLGVENAGRILKKDVPTFEEIENAFDSDLGLMPITLEFFASDISGNSGEEPKKEKAQKLTYKK